MGPVRAATRSSPLALWQTRHVAALLRSAHPGLDVEELAVSTLGDRRLDVPIHEMGGKGVFAKEVQEAVLDGRADLAVHSGKDLPALTPPGLVVAAVPLRADPRDVLVGARLVDLAPGALVGTGSVRRRAQLAWLRPDLRFGELRGNIGTRLEKAAAFDAIVMAKAALDRLGLTPAVVDPLPVDVVVPQVAQGALVVECRADDERLRDLLAAVEDAATRRVVDAERAFLIELGGDCDLPAGAHGVIDGGRVRLTAVLAAGAPVVVHRVEVADEPVAAGTDAARRLRAAATADG
jgi:hydroxymethylbilane synthase